MTSSRGGATEEQEVCQSSGPTDRNLLKESTPHPTTRFQNCPAQDGNIKPTGSDGSGSGAGHQQHGAIQVNIDNQILRKGL